MRRTIVGDNGALSEYTQMEQHYSETIKQLMLTAGYDGILVDKYELLDNAYRASGGFEDGSYLIPYPSERAEKYLRRKNMAYYINYVKPVVDAHINPVFKNPPTREGMSSTFQQFVNDVDGNGTTLTRFMKKASIRAKLHGVEFIVVDMEELQEGTLLTQKQMIDNRVYPYLYLVSPKQIQNYYTDKFGRLISITYTVQNTTLDNDGNAKEITEIWTWTKDNCRREINGNKVDMPNKLGIIPIIPLYGATNDTDDLLVQPDVLSIGKVAFAIFNGCSELRELHRRQAFSILTYPIADDDEYNSGENPIQLGTSDCLLYRASTGSAPAFITPPTSSSDVILNEINFCIKEIYRMANMRMVTGVSQYNVSASAKQQDSENLYREIDELAQNIQETEYKIAQVFARYLNESMDNYIVVYTPEYGIADITETLNSATTALTMNICADFNEEVKKQVIKTVLSDVDSRIVSNILEKFKTEPTKGEPIEGEVKTVQPTTN